MGNRHSSTGNAAELSAIQAVVFDFDGTLAETNIDFALMRERVIEAARRWDAYCEGEQRGYILEVVEDARRLLPDERSWEQFRRETEAMMQEVELAACSSAEPFEGVPEALARLQECGYRLGIITRNSGAGVRAVMERHHLPHEVLLTRDDVERVKPAPDHLEQALAALGVEAERALMVGDHPTDIECGKAAGAYTAGVLTAKTTREQFEEMAADLVADSVPALATLLCDTREGR